MSVELDLKYRHWTKQHGDLTFIGTWIRSDAGEYHTCMVIIRTAEERNEHTIPCIVPMDTAWRWSEQIGDGAYTARVTANFLQALRIDFTINNAIRLTSLIHDHIGDLLRIPPFETLGVDQIVTADLRRVNMNTGEVFETEIKDNV